MPFISPHAAPTASETATLLIDRTFTGANPRPVKSWRKAPDGAVTTMQAARRPLPVSRAATRPPNVAWSITAPSE